MREAGLHALQPCTYVPRTSDGRADAPSPNLLDGQPLPARPNAVWAGDITFIPTSTGWLYLAVIIELPALRSGHAECCRLLRRQVCRCRYRGRAFRSRRSCFAPPHVAHPCASLRGSLSAGGLAPLGCDRGSQYGSKIYRALLRRAGLRQSMSARANPYHNAWSESAAGR